MAQTQIRGSTQILDGSINAVKFVTGLNLPTSQLQDGSKILMRDGSVSFTSSQSMGGFTLTNIADPVNITDAVNLRTAQALVNGISVKPSTHVVSISNIATLSGLQTVDGISLVAGNRILLVGQTTAAQNGIWLISASSWTRPLDYATGSEQKEGILVIVAAGTAYHDTKWLSITDGLITVDTTTTVWNQDLSGIIYQNGAGLSLIGSAFAVKTGAGISFDGSSNVYVKTGAGVSIDGSNNVYVKTGNGIAIDGSNNVTVGTNGTSLSSTSTGIKITDGVAGQLMLANASNAATFTTVTGDLAISNSGVTTVTSVAGVGFLKYGAIVGNETPVGSINSANVSYTLGNTPQNTSLQLYLNGQLLDPGAGNDYTLSGTTITVLFAPITGDKLRAFYLK